MRIWKYDVDPGRGRHVFEFSVPTGAKPVALRQQHGNLNLWMEVDPTGSQGYENVRFEWFGTGFDIPDDAPYVGTEMIYQDSLVLHLYGPFPGAAS